MTDEPQALKSFNVNFAPGYTDMDMEITTDTGQRMAVRFSPEQTRALQQELNRLWKLAQPRPLDPQP